MRAKREAARNRDPWRKMKEAMRSRKGESANENQVKREGLWRDRAGQRQLQLALPPGLPWRRSVT